MAKTIKSIIVAIARNGVIGRGKELPWHIPADLAYFKKTTSGHPVIMGMATHESIGRLLPGRKNVVLSDLPDFKPTEGAFKAASFQEAFKLAEDDQEVFIIGGASVYEQALEFADRLYLTEVQADIDGDIYFPEFDKNQWVETKRENYLADEKSFYNLNFIVYERRK
ncbi:dihydrofolate reductase [Patescibacteria group bacterium]|nr:dihydrofolate reductase [Patescibacteria group bacterium]MBU4142787.1 dihydrofolate reductase [Patescibacteria group bacterium]